MTIKKGTITGIRYFLVHFCVEIICFMTLRSRYPLGISAVVALMFDTFAFVPQALFGELIDKYRKLPIESVAVGLMAIGTVIAMLFGANTVLMVVGIVIMAIGNAILHEEGALHTVADSEGKFFPSALFVAGGSFGVVLGGTLGKFGVSPIWLIVPFAVLEILLLTDGKLAENMEYPTFDIIAVRKKDGTKIAFPIALVIMVAFFVTTVRSYMGYAIPISWKKELWQDFLLFFVMGIGKALGGYLTDRFGARRIGVWSTLLSIPFLIIGNNNMVISVIGVCLFSMTMCITFEMILSVLPKNPGLAFGVTTIGLFMGILPVFFVNIGVTLNSVLVVVLSLICSVLLGVFLSARNPKLR